MTSGRNQLTTSVNGAAFELLIASHETLLDTLRDRLGLTGTKKGCDVVFVGEPDPLTPLGAKGVGEIGLVGIAAAVANGIHHATGRRIRSTPITLDRLPFW